MKEPVSPVPMEEEVGPSRRPAWLRYSVAIAVTAIAFGIRWKLDPVLPNGRIVFVPFIVATIIVTWYGGTGPAVLCAFSGFALAAYFFLEPRHSFLVHNSLETVLPAVLVQSSIIVFGHAMHRARNRASAHAQRAIENQKRLELEVIERTRAEDEVRRLNAELEQRVQQRTAELQASN